MSKKPREASERYVMLRHWVMRTAAWRDLDAVAKCAYVELSSRYAGPGTNNGMIPYSLKEMAEALNIGKATAMRAMARLQDHGFIRRRAARRLQHQAPPLERVPPHRVQKRPHRGDADQGVRQLEKTEHGFTTRPHRVLR